MNAHVHPYFAEILNNAAHQQLTDQQKQREYYLALLKAHDWSYDYSEDFSRWQAGHSQHLQLTRLQRLIDPEYALWNQHAPAAYQRTARRL